MGLDRSANGIFASLLALAGAILAAAFAVTMMVLRLVWHRRHKLPHSDVSVPLLLIAAAVLLIAGPVPALLVAAVLTAWILGAPNLEQRYSDGGESAPAALAGAASTARAVRLQLAALDVRFAIPRACKHDTVRLAPIRVRGRGVQHTPGGWSVPVRFAPGQTAEQVDRARGALASALNVRDVKVYRHATKARLGTLTLAIGENPLAGMSGHSWPLLNAQRTSIWDGVPIGLDETNRPVTVDLVYKNVLLGGIPNAGKSNVLNMLVGHCALDPTVRLHLLDGKGMVELHTWQASAESMAGDVTEAIPILRALTEILNARQADLKALDKKKVRRGDDLPIHVVAVDELSEFTTAPKTKNADPAKEFNALLRPIVNVGRACGIVVIGCTLKPEGKVVDTNMRDLFSTRIALECRTPEMSDTILGKSMATQGWNAQQISGQPGRAILVGEKTGPRHFQAFLLDDRDDSPDSDVKQIARRAAALREAEGTLTTHKVQPPDESSAPVPGPVSAPAAAEPLRNYAPVAHEAPTGPEPSRAIAHGLRAVPDGPVDAALVVMPEKNGHSKRALKVVHLEMELAKDPDRSLRELGRVVGMSEHTVKVHRERLGYPPFRRWA